MRTTENRLINKLKSRLRYHKLSRKQAALQNLMLTALVVMIGVLGLQTYEDSHSPEAVIKEWCEKMYFGEAEILSTLDYRGEKHPYKDVVIGKQLPNGERYEAKLTMEQRNPWRWEFTGSAMWNTAPMEYDIGDGSPEALADMFIGFENFDELYVFDTPTTYTAMSEEGVSDVRLIPTITVAAKQAEKIDSVTYMRDYSFCLYPETGEIRTMSKDPVVMTNGREGTLWLSEERMVFIAEKLMELMAL